MSTEAWSSGALVPPSMPSLTNLIEAFPEPSLLTAGSQHILQFANSKACSALGITEPWLGKSLEMLLDHGTDRNQSGVMEVLDSSSLEGEEALMPLKLSLWGEEIPVTWSVLPIDAPGCVSYLHRVYPDQEEPVEPQTVDFLADVSHELRTPLSALVATTEVMLQDYHSIPSSELGHMVALLHRNTRRLESLVGNLLDAASLRNGKFQLRKTVTSVQSLVRDAVDFVLPLLDSKNQRLETRMVGRAPVVVVDSKRIVGVLINLLSNASRYAPPNEPIQLIVTNEGSIVRFTVRQKGAGIPKHEQVRLFQRFYRGSGEHVSGGSGLGLAIVKDIVEMHDGTVGIMSKPGKTTAFWFTIPIGGVTSDDGSTAT